MKAIKALCFCVILRPPSTIAGLFVAHRPHSPVHPIHGACGLQPSALHTQHLLWMKGALHALLSPLACGKERAGSRHHMLALGAIQSCVDCI